MALVWRQPSWSGGWVGDGSVRVGWDLFLPSFIHTFNILWVLMTP